MPKTLFEHLSPDTGAKRILALDGGGVKGILTLGMLKALEDELRRRAGGDSAFRLSDYYDLIGGTSTGAIISSGLALGMSVDEMIELYARLGPDVFGRTAGDGVFLQSKFESKKLRRALTAVLSTKTLGSQDLKTGLAIHAKRIDTGSAWVVTNHPLGVFYDPASDSGVFPNKRYRLVDLVLASAAAPTFFDEITIDIEFDDKRRPIQKGYFVDGAVSANNNPSMQLFMLALEPAYRFGWRAGESNLMMTSCGTGARRPTVDGKAFQGLPPGLRGVHALRAMVYDTQIQGVMMMQAFSNPKKPWRVNSEVGDMAGVCISGTPLLDYQRMDVVLDTKPKRRRASDPVPPMTGLERLLGRELEAEIMEALDLMDNGKKANMDLLLEVGIGAGRSFVDASYPDPKFDLLEWRGS
ncbi:patatin-like phospholipase family protein [Terricaulis silvestris]|uniref:Patatin n=1 Tax=Terricaulis silvestris TaxID=2686094 RepID=A0A6I6MQK0_9CAUL|nr:patatin-like phospholipase family protein [Terricaulis silvestris]QGZ94974.1 Patatin [Terricaulis silvestris]